MDKTTCHVCCMWHTSQGMLDKKRLVTSDFSPVVYSSGEGLFSVMGYIMSMTDEYISVLIDNTFAITVGDPPDEKDGLICDSIKKAIQNVISKTIAITKLTLKSSNRPSKLDIIVDDINYDNMPSQLMEIDAWEKKSLVIDHDATVSDDFDPSFYFEYDVELDRITQIIRNWDQYFELSKAAIDTIVSDVDKIDVTEESAQYIQVIARDMDILAEILTEKREYILTKFNLMEDGE